MRKVMAPRTEKSSVANTYMLTFPENGLDKVDVPKDVNELFYLVCALSRQPNKSFKASASQFIQVA